MAFMMERYEDELKKPIRNIVNGQLLRTILIQACNPPPAIRSPRIHRCVCSLLYPRAVNVQ